jgi:Clathrin adaptor complex small chain
VTDNELLLMETIHLFVELLDEYFSDVCEVSFHENDQTPNKNSLDYVVIPFSHSWI